MKLIRGRERAYTPLLMSTQVPRVVAILPRLSPSAWINIIKPLVALHEAGQIRAWVTLERLGSARNVERADVIVFSRNVSPDRAVSSAQPSAAACR